MRLVKLLCGHCTLFCMLRQSIDATAGSLAASGVSDEPVAALRISGSSITLITSTKVATAHVRVWPQQHEHELVC